MCSVSRLYLSLQIRFKKFRAGFSFLISFHFLTITQYYWNAVQLLHTSHIGGLADSHLFLQIVYNLINLICKFNQTYQDLGALSYSVGSLVPLISNAWRQIY